ncbi:HPP family protein [Marinibaculum pumilum]|uniref:HPP family protein n=1 Tax=Marinibaculum pumilum TaxID=1766165 RepID=A0ABV7KXD3_9PROT
MALRFPATFLPRLGRLARHLRTAGLPGHLDSLHAGIGALIGIAVTGLVAAWWGDGSLFAWLVAPMGASAVLLFAVPASPLARPWAILGGNSVSAAVGTACAAAVPQPALAAGLAVGLAIVAMRATRCLHPPGGAAALTAVLGGQAVAQAGWGFALAPVALNAALLVAAGWLYHRLTGHAYPHGGWLAARRPPPEPEPATGFTAEDLEAALADQDELLDIDRQDLSDLLHRVERLAMARTGRRLTCAAMMVPAPAPAGPETRVAAARERLLREGLTDLPVVGTAGRVIGTVGHAHLAGSPLGMIDAVMDPMPCLAAPDRTAAQLIPQLADGRHRVAWIVDREGRLQGAVWQADLLAALAGRLGAGAEIPRTAAARHA